MCVGTDGNPAWVGVLNDYAGGRIQGLDTLPRCIGIGNIVIREFLALMPTVVGKRTFNASYITIERC